MRLAVAVTTLGLATTAQAEPLRLRGDALASAQAPAGLLVLSGDGGTDGDNGTVSAEALVWLGLDGDAGTSGDTEVDGDALVIAVVARSPQRRAEARLGRFVATAGALRPVHLDGIAGRIRLPHRLDVEVLGGVPVTLGAARTWDWVTGARVGRRIGDWGGAGVALLERRDAGRLAVRELGLDTSAALGATDVGARVAFDLIDPAPADVVLSVRRKVGPVRAELSAQHRVPSHLVPATSLFSVLGDVPSQYAGAAVTWRAAPRLDVMADAGARALDGEVAADGALRATLRLDDRGRGALSGELRRGGAIEGGWLGARGAARVPAGPVTVALELELVVPDEDRGRGTVWPWALAALGYRRGAWDAALAVEASASPEYEHRVDVLAQVGRRWEAP